MEKIIKSDDEWRQILTEEQFRVTRKHGTEPPFLAPSMTSMMPVFTIVFVAVRRCLTADKI